MTFDATVNPVAYEGGEAVFIDAERDTWNMDPDALERAFELYPDTKMVVLAHLYGTPAKITEIRKICDAHGALLIEDAAESLGAYLAFSDGTSTMTGAFGDIGIVSFNGNKIITGSCGGALLAHAQEVADRIRKWSTQSRESALWYQHEELGYNYRMSNVVAGVIRGQLGHLEEHIAQKKAIYERYREGFSDLPVTMNPLGGAESHPNYWLSCVLIDRDAMCPAERTGTETTWTHVPGRSCPDELFEALKTFNAEGRPIWKPMHMQPIYREHPFVTAAGSSSPAGQPAQSAHSDTPPEDPSVSADIFARGFCLPSDNKMTPEDQDRIIEIVRRCFA
jgi:dTDP-4-amino-4,6-dideoxygalactose transaminase